MKATIVKFRLWKQDPLDPRKTKALIGVDIPEWGLALRNLQVVHDEQGWYVMPSSVCAPNSAAKIAYFKIGMPLEMAIRKAVLEEYGEQLMQAVAA